MVFAHQISGNRQLAASQSCFRNTLNTFLNHISGGRRAFSGPASLGFLDHEFGRPKKCAEEFFTGFWEGAVGGLLTCY